MNTNVKACPLCEEEMRKDCNSDETVWWWQCTCCSHTETMSIRDAMLGKYNAILAKPHTVRRRH